MTASREALRARNRETGMDRRGFLLGFGALVTSASGCAAAPPTEREPLAPSLPRQTVESEGLLGIIARRRSVRRFAEETVSLEQIGVMLRAAQGITDPERQLRAVPSASALYPLSIYAATAEGVARYSAEQDDLERLGVEDVRTALAHASAQQSFIAEAPVVFVVTGDYRLSSKHRERAERFVHLEAGHAAQNLLLAAVSLGLGGATIGSFNDHKIRLIIRASKSETTLYVIPTGHPASAL